MASPSDDDRAARRLGSAFLAIVVVTYGLLIFGASVRVHGAGLSCPDWPLCFGEVIPRLDFRIFLEWGHRVLASMVSIGFLTAGGLALARKDTRARVGALIGAAVLALALQIVLGGLTVLHLLAFWSVTLHLLTGNLFCNLLLLIGLRLRAAGAPVTGLVTPRLRVLGVVLTGAVFVQLGLGGLVASNYAGMACTEWPTCNGGVWFPTFTGIVGLQLVHRLGAYAVAALALTFWWTARGSVAERPANVVLGLVAVQIGLGIANVLLAMPVELAILHSAVADLILLSSVWSVNRVYAAVTSPEVRDASPSIRPA